MVAEIGVVLIVLVVTFLIFKNRFIEEEDGGLFIPRLLLLYLYVIVFVAFILKTVVFYELPLIVTNEPTKNVQMQLLPHEDPQSDFYLIIENDTKKQYCETDIHGTKGCDNSIYTFAEKDEDGFIYHKTIKSPFVYWHEEDVKSASIKINKVTLEATNKQKFWLLGWVGVGPKTITTYEIIVPKDSVYIKINR
jgi:hypothetical protein